MVFIDPVDMDGIHPARLARDTRTGRIEVLDHLGADGHQSTSGVAIRMQ
jgi:hypothetical protein